MVVRLVLRDLEAALADHDAKLAFVVDGMRRIERTFHDIARAAHTCRRLREDDRVRGNLFLAARIEPARMELGGMGEVILAHAEDVTRRCGDRRQETNLAERHAPARRRTPSVARLAALPDEIENGRPRLRPGDAGDGVLAVDEARRESSIHLECDESHYLDTLYFYR